MTDFLGRAYPTIAKRLRKLTIASLPTPVTQHEVATDMGTRHILIKHDELTNADGGGNKIRKLEYLLQRAQERGAKRIATFGAVGSNHALATAVHARSLGLNCTCFLAHQKHTPNIAKTLNRHLELGTELVRYGGSVDRLALFRQYLQQRETWVIPLGGTCWLGVVGFVNAGLELASQLASDEIATPNRIYMANGTMGSVAGLAIGLALANIDVEIHAVRIADKQFVRRDVLDRIKLKTATMLNRLDPSIPVDIATRTRITWRDDFYAGGYAAVDETTLSAVQFAHDSLSLKLDTTYTGKAMAALLYDINRDAAADNALFWSTYSSTSLAINQQRDCSQQGLPEQFESYYD